MASLQGFLNPLSRVPITEEIQPDQSESQETDKNEATAENIEGLLEDMNKMAGKIQQVAPPPLALSPSKRRSEEAPSTDARDTVSPKRLRPNKSTPGLQRKPTAPLTRSTRSNRLNWDVDVDDVADGEHDHLNLLPKAGKRRVLAKRIPVPSPLKGQGIIDIENGNVNFSESPSKRPARRPNRNLTQRGDDDSASKKKIDPQTASPKLLTRAGKEYDHSGDLAPQSNSDTVHQSSRKEQNPEQAHDDMVSKDQPRAEHPSREASQANETHPTAGVDSGNDGPEPEPEREASKKRKGHAQQRVRDIVKHQAKELEGLEAVTELYGCRPGWVQVLVGCKMLKELQSKPNPESQTGLRLYKRLKKFRLRLRQQKRSSVAQEIDTELTVEEEINLITRDVSALQSRDGGSSERPKRARDLYGHILPAFALTLKSLLHFRLSEGSLPAMYLGEISALLESAHEAAHLACRWDPRPSMLSDGSLSWMRNAIRPNLGVLQCTFEALDELGQKLAADKETRERLYACQQRNIEAQKEQDRRRQAAIINSRPKPTRAESSQQIPVVAENGTETEMRPSVGQKPDRPHGMSREAFFHQRYQKNDGIHQRLARRERIGEIRGRHLQAPRMTAPLDRYEDPIDIDALDLDDLDIYHTHSRAMPERPRLARAQTEEIPAPTLPEWTVEERRVFLNALQQDLSAARFENILAAYGGPGNVLERHDIDSLMSHARYVKQSIGRKLAAQGEDDMWLRIVPL